MKYKLLICFAIIVVVFELTEQQSVARRHSTDSTSSVASPDNKNERPGKCPTPRKRNSVLCPMQQCRADERCPSGYKCCPSGCGDGTECREAVHPKREGTCPSKELHPSNECVPTNKSRQCSKDNDCSDDPQDLCCPNRCGYRVCTTVRRISRFIRRSVRHRS